MSRFIQKYSLVLHPSKTNSTADTDSSVSIPVHALLLELRRFPIGKKKKSVFDSRRRFITLEWLKINERQERET